MKKGSTKRIVSPLLELIRLVLLAAWFPNDGNRRISPEFKKSFEPRLRLTTLSNDRHVHQMQHHMNPTSRFQFCGALCGSAVIFRIMLSSEHTAQQGTRQWHYVSEPSNRIYLISYGAAQGDFCFFARIIKLAPASFQGSGVRAKKTWQS
jgi:hypothetical protein